MEIFITLIKYNTHQRHKEGKPLFVVTTYYYPLPYKSVQRMFEEWDTPINVHR